ncbi:MAG TPA: YihY/virulence factor BrkB family protein [Chitinophagaceae bacterium]|nr:YihY/virulence factor BrkB family protein [Chitinophagaceae bacterium]
MFSFTQIRQKIISSFPASWLINQSKKIQFPGFYGIPLYDVVKFFYQQVRRVGLTERTSAISFNFIMAVPPMIIFLFTLIPYLPISQALINQLYELIRDIIPGKNNYQPIIEFLDDFLNNQRYGLLSVGFLLALYYSSNAMAGIMRAFDKNYIGFRKRSFWEAKKTALQLTLILFLLVIVSLVLLIMQGSILRWLGIESAWLRNIIVNARWIIIILLFLASISFIYRHAPFVHKKWRLVNPGSVLATTLMIFFIILFSYWVNHFSNYNKLYGSIGTLLLLMLLIYFNSLVLLIGFELNVSINSLKHEADERKKLETSGNQSA